MKVVDLTQSPGSPTKPTEDRAGSSGNLAWVIDGATDFTNEKTLPGISNVQWLVDIVHQGLFDVGATAGYKGVRDIFEDLGEKVRARLSELSPADLRNHPCCSIGLAVFHADSVELGRIGDATLIAYKEAQVVGEVSTDFFEAREREAVEQSLTARQTKQEIVDAMFSRRVEYIKGRHEESVFSGHPEAIFRVHSKIFSLRSADTVLICTDGFARAVVDYKIFADWQGLGCYAHEKGLEKIAFQVRRFESNPEPASSKKFKNADDLAAILLVNGE